MKRIATRGFSLKPLLAALALSLPGAAMAEQLFVPLTRDADMTRYDSNYIELGGAYNDGDSYKFGEFTGLDKQGGYVIGNFNVAKRYGDLNYLDASGFNLGLDSRQLGAEYGAQGRYWIDAGYDQLYRYQYDDTQFIHNGLGGNYQTLSPACGGFAQPNNAAGQAIVNPCLRTYEIEQKRQDWKIGGGFFRGTNWKFSVDYRETKQDGDRIQGAVMGNSGGNPRAAILPYDRDSKTHQVEARAEWTTKQAQANVSFWYSKYDPDSNSRSWQNPYSNAWGAACNPGAGGCAFPTGFGRVGLMPENEFWQLKGTGAWNITPKSRLTGTLSYSVMTQDESFLPYTINGPAAPGGPTQTPGTNLVVNTPLPRGSLDGKIENTLFDVSYLTKPIDKLSVKLDYQYRKHDNKTPSDWYSYIGGDTTDQVSTVGVDPNTVNSNRVRRNLPPGTTENKVKVDGTYALMRGLSVRGWYQYKKIDYKEASEELRSDTDDNEVGVELHKTMSAQVSGWLRYAYDQRRGSNFSTTRPYQASYSNAYVNNLPANNGANLVDNITTLRQFFVADSKTNTFTAFGSFNPADRVSFGLRGDYFETKYQGPDCGQASDQILQGLAPPFTFPAECLGRQKATGKALTLDTSFTPTDGVNTFAFYTYQTYQTDQTGRAWSGGNNAQATDATRDWNNTIEQHDNTFGLGARYQPSSKKWDAGLQYVYTVGKGSYNPYTGTTLAPGGVESVPKTISRTNSFQLFAKYNYSRKIIVRFNYWYEQLQSQDWAYDNATPTSSSNVLLTGHQSPQYTNNYFGLSVAYTDW